MIAVAVLLLSPAPGQAADIKLTERPECGVSLSGDIEVGDYDRFASVAASAGNQGLCLNSPGGSWMEGVKIAEYVMDHFVGTYVGAGQQCKSACAIVFLAGARKSRVVKKGSVEEDFLTAEWFRLPNRTMHVTAKVGFHAPYLVMGEKQYTARDVETARIAALQAFGKFLGLLAQKREVENVNNFVPKRFISRAMRMGRDELLMIDTVDIAGWLGVDLVGYKAPRRLSREDIYWAAYKKLLVWGGDRSLSELSKSNDVWQYSDAYAKGLSEFERRGAFQMGIFFRGEEMDGDLVYETYMDNDRPFIYSGIHTFGRPVLYDDPSKVPYWKLNEMVDVEKDKRRFTGITRRLHEGGYDYLLTPLWYIYPAKTKLADIAAK